MAAEAVLVGKNVLFFSGRVKQLKHCSASRVLRGGDTHLMSLSRANRTSDSAGKKTSNWSAANV